VVCSLSLQSDCGGPPGQPAGLHLRRSTAPNRIDLLHRTSSLRSWSHRTVRLTVAGQRSYAILAFARGAARACRGRGHGGRDAGDRRRAPGRVDDGVVDCLRPLGRGWCPLSRPCRGRRPGGPGRPKAADRPAAAARRVEKVSSVSLQLPAQVVDQGGALTDQPFAAIGEQAHVELRALKLGDRPSASAGTPGSSRTTTRPRARARRPLRTAREALLDQRRGPP
jgi:hypothetical protein